MVRCFLIHTVCPVGAVGTGDSRVLYSRVFGPDEGMTSELSPEERRLLQKEKTAVVARWVTFYTCLMNQISVKHFLMLLLWQTAKQHQSKLLCVVLTNISMFLTDQLWSLIDTWWRWRAASGLVAHYASTLLSLHPADVLMPQPSPGDVWTLTNTDLTLCDSGRSAAPSLCSGKLRASHWWRWCPARRRWPCRRPTAGWCAWEPVTPSLRKWAPCGSGSRVWASSSSASPTRTSYWPRGPYATWPDTAWTTCTCSGQAARWAPCFVFMKGAPARVVHLKVWSTVVDVVEMKDKT